jgi:circadian clock protein KaiC
MAFGALEEFAVREYIREIILFLEEKIGATTVLTCDIPSGSTRLSRFGYEEFLSSGVIVLGLRNIGGRLVRTLMVRKMRWSPADMTIYTFEIMGKRGIVIGPPLTALESGQQPFRFQQEQQAQAEEEGYPDEFDVRPP